MKSACLSSLALFGLASAVTSKYSRSELQELFGNDFGFSGISTFAHLPHVKCLVDPDVTYDIAILGVPFDTAVTYRTGARFGPRAIRSASSRQLPSRGYNPRARLNPYRSWATLLDCGDIPVTPFDNALALRQMTEAYRELSTRRAVIPGAIPKIVSLGGDHSIALAELRALRELHGQPITVLHLDAHLDTWVPNTYGSAWFDDSKNLEDEQSAFTHGTMFWLAHREGLIANGSVHAGLRTRLSDAHDEADDDTQGWMRFASDEVSAPPEGLGPAGLAAEIVAALGGGDGRPVLLSVDIDVIDPGLAPGTGTPEPGGWSTRELVQVIRGLEGLNLVAADVVEVAPGYDGHGEQTALAAAQVVFEILTSMVKYGEGHARKGKSRGSEKDEL